MLVVFMAGAFGTSKFRDSCNIVISHALLETDDFARDYAAFSTNGVRFLEAPRHEIYGSVAVFEDLYGNKWDLLERRVP